MKRFPRITTIVVGPIVLLGASVAYVAISGNPIVAHAQQTDSEQSAAIELPTGKMLTPTAAHGASLQNLNPGLASASDLRTSQAAALATSPDGRMLAILTSEYNRHYGKNGDET